MSLSTDHDEMAWRSVAPADSPALPPGVIWRSLCFAVLVCLMLTVFSGILGRLLRFSFAFQEGTYSHIILIPLISAFLFLRHRRTIFSHLETRWAAGLGLVFAGALFYSFAQRYSTMRSENDQLFMAMSSLLIIWVGAFLLCFGARALRAGLFPVLFLLLAVPIPDLLLERAIFWLQSGSAEGSDLVFQLLGVPFFRTGPVFSLPGISIEVAKECSGIHSALALLIATLLGGHFFLQSASRKGLLLLAALPLLVVKNVIRIVTFSLLGVYVDHSFLTGALHRKGGVLFFLVALAALAPVLLLLSKSERSRSS
jgi:exosortase